MQSFTDVLTTVALTSVTPITVIAATTAAPTTSFQQSTQSTTSFVQSTQGSTIAQCTDDNCCAALNLAAAPCTVCMQSPGCVYFADKNAQNGGRCLFKGSNAPANLQRVSAVQNCADWCNARQCNDCMQVGAGCVWCNNYAGTAGVCARQACQAGYSLLTDSRRCPRSSASAVSLTLAAALAGVLAALFM